MSDDNKIIPIESHIKRDPRTKKPQLFLQPGLLADQATEVEAQLVEQGVPVYRNGAMLVEPVIQEVEASHGRKAFSAGMHELSATRLRDLMSRYLSFKRYHNQAKQWMWVEAPFEIAETIVARKGSNKFKPLTGLMTSPTIRPDGSILRKAGYDASTGIYLIEPPEIDTPTHPTRADACEALRTLESLLREFPFTSEAAKSVALSAFITCVVRAALSRAPMHMVSATTAGTGKSFLVDVASTIASGFPCPVISAGKSEEEMEKRLGAALVMGRPIISIDNVNGVLGGDFLCHVIERPQADVRILGKTQLVRVNNSIVLFSTGNNIQPSGDVVRRSLVAQLDAGIERPELRRFDKDPLETAGRNRGLFIGAILTIVRAYILAGKPHQANSLASFREWHEFVRSPLMWLGCADPVETMASSRDTDPEIVRIAILFNALEEAGFNLIEEQGTVNEILMHAAKDRELRSALTSLGKRGEMPDARGMGNILRSYKDRVVDGLRLRAVDKSDKSKRSNKWYIERLDNAVE